MNGKNVMFTIVISFISLFLAGVSFAQEMPHVIDFELEIEMKDNSKYDIEYELFDDRYEAEYQVPNSNSLYGKEAKAMIEPLLQRLELTPDADVNKVREDILSIFTINKSKVDELELEVKFSNGQKLKIDQ